ncbi:MAG: GNAT family N-acetyltransferase [Oleiphilaceae bacterium]|nr:GNAT family N-acetyltransferase [Oleiphilaceae bacterium]
MQEKSAIHWQVHAFDTLTTEQLYAVLRLRETVFVVEQQCIYHDIDGLDLNAEHILALRGHKKELVAYCRVLAPGVRYEEVAIGRVIVAAPYRHSGLGGKLMQRALRHCDHRYPGTGVRISAQQHLVTFYQRQGFTVVSEPYDEDGIPHVEMRCSGASGEQEGQA